MATMNEVSLRKKTGMRMRNNEDYIKATRSQFSRDSIGCMVLHACRSSDSAGKISKAKLISNDKGSWRAVRQCAIKSKSQFLLFYFIFFFFATNQYEEFGKCEFESRVKWVCNVHDGVMGIPVLPLRLMFLVESSSCREIPGEVLGCLTGIVLSFLRIEHVLWLTELDGWPNTKWSRISQSHVMSDVYSGTTSVCASQPGMIVLNDLATRLKSSARYH